MHYLTAITQHWFTASFFLFRYFNLFLFIRSIEYKFIQIFNNIIINYFRIVIFDAFSYAVTVVVVILDIYSSNSKFLVS